MLLAAQPAFVHERLPSLRAASEMALPRASKLFRDLAPPDESRLWPGETNHKPKEW